jgi:hypothetical protein
MKIIAIALVALALATGASAGLPTHPGQRYSAFASRMVCDRLSFQTTPVSASGDVTVHVSVNGHQINGYILGTHVVEWGGYGILVRITQRTHRAPLAVRAASVRSDCARVNILATW